MKYLIIIKYYKLQNNSILHCTIPDKSMQNKYKKRLVANKDTQMCMVCSKPTTTVLYNDTGPDWIYCCPLHLIDNPHFATPSYDSEYLDVVDQLKLTKSQLDSLTNKKDGNWDVWVTSIFNKRKSQHSKKDENDKETEQGENEGVDTAKVNKNNKEQTMLDLKQKYDTLLDQMLSLQKANKQYQLNDKIYQYRVQRLKQQQLNLQRRKEEEKQYTNTSVEQLQEKLNFPEVPKGPIN